MQVFTNKNIRQSYWPTICLQAKHGCLYHISWQSSLKTAKIMVKSAKKKKKSWSSIRYHAAYMTKMKDPSIHHCLSFAGSWVSEEDTLDKSPVHHRAPNKVRSACRPVQDLKLLKRSECGRQREEWTEK